MDHYKDAFEEALSWTKEQGLDVPETYFSDERLMNASSMQQLTLAVKDLFKSMSLDDIKAQHLSLHQNLQETVEDVFECPVFYTIGYVHMPPNDYFKLSHDDLAEFLKKGQKNIHLKLHAWLTFPTMEILDFSINTVLAEAVHRPEIAGKMLAAHPSTFSGGLQFHPILIGDDLLKK